MKSKAANISEFYKKVYEIVAQIPKGKVATYGQIAFMAGSPMAARAVGEAMRKTPQYLNIPCHRVVSKSGKMAPGYAFGGMDKQIKILKNEGIPFKRNGCIDMKTAQWQI